MSQCHSQKSKSNCNNESVKDSFFNTFIINTSGEFGIAGVLGSECFILWKADLSINWIEPRLARLDACSGLKIGFNYYFEISRIAQREILIGSTGFELGSDFGIVDLIKIGWIRVELPLFQRTHAMMNMVRAKMAPTTVQQQSVIFLYFSLTGNCSGRIAFSSNIWWAINIFNKYKFNKNKYTFYLTATSFKLSGIFKEEEMSS